MGNEKMYKHGDKKSPSKTESRNRKPDYSANLRAWDKAKIQQLKDFIKSDPTNAVALVPISVGSNPNHNNGRFLAMLSLLKGLGFTSIVVLVADVLQRYYRLIRQLHIILKNVLDKFKSQGEINPSEDQIDAAMDAAVKEELEKLSIVTRDDGYQWILSNINSIEEVFGRNYTMHRWDLGCIRTVDNPKHASNDVQSFPVTFSFAEQLEQYEKCCVEKPQCANAVNESTQQFLSRLEQRETNKAEAESNFSRLLNKYRKQYSDAYIREETAAMLALHDNDPRPLPVGYPGGANPALIQAVKDCIKLETGQTYPFILGEVGKEPGTGLDVRIRETTISVDETEIDEADIPEKSQPIPILNPKKIPRDFPEVATNSTPVVTNPALLRGSFFRPNGLAAAIIAQNAAIIEQNNMLLQEALKYEQQIVISPPH